MRNKILINRTYIDALSIVNLLRIRVGVSTRLGGLPLADSLSERPLSVLCRSSERLRKNFSTESLRMETEAAVNMFQN